MKIIEYIDPVTKKTVGLLNLDHLVRTEYDANGNTVLFLSNGDTIVTKLDIHQIESVANR